MLVIITILWDSILLQPLKVFASYIHQLGHLIFAIIFSYDIKTDIIINLTDTSYKIINQRGAVSAFFIANGGYILGVLFSFFVIHLKETPSKKYAPGVFALFFIAVAGIYSGISRQLLYSAIFAGVAVVLHMLHKNSVYEMVLEVISVSNITYIIYDIAINTVYYELNLHFKFSKWINYIPYSDALQLQVLTGIPPIVWGIIWIILILVNCFIFLDVSDDPSSNTDATPPT
jgi:hypothetical protein